MDFDDFVAGLYKWKWYVLFGIIAIGTASQSWYIVNDGYVGVQQTFGKLHDRVLFAGFNLKSPITTVTKVRIADTTATYNDSKELDTIDRLSEAMFWLNNKTDSGTTIKVGFKPTIIFALNPATTPQLIKTLGGNWQYTYLRQIVQDSLQKALSSIDLSSPMVTIESVKTEVEKIMSQLFKERGDYIRLINVNIDYVLDQAILDAGIAIFKARQAQLEAESLQVKRKIELATLLLEAENNAKIAALKATAPIDSVVTYFVNRGLTEQAAIDKAIMLLQLNAWNGSLPLVMGDNGGVPPPIAPIFAIPPQVKQ
jgi:hypothetical protein